MVVSLIDDNTLVLSQAEKDKIYDFIRRINTELDNRANNAACLAILSPQEAREREMMREAMSSTRCLAILLIIMMIIIVGCIAYFVSLLGG